MAGCLQLILTTTFVVFTWKIARKTREENDRII